MAVKPKKKAAKSKLNRRALPEYITIQLDGIKKTVLTKDYIKIKTGDLREFGYTNLTEDEVREQLLKIANKEELDIIGKFIEGDIVKI